MAVSQRAANWFGPGRRAAWRRRILRRLLAALLAATVVSVVVNRLVPRTGVPVAVAAGALADGSVLTVADVATRLVPPDLVGEAARSPTQVVGQRLAGRIDAGEPFTPTRFVPRATDGNLPPGTVPVHVRVADAASLDVLQIGDRVVVHAAVAEHPAVAERALVLSIDPPQAGPALGAAVTLATRGAVLALAPAQAAALLTGSPDPMAPMTAHLVLVAGR